MSRKGVPLCELKGWPEPVKPSLNVGDHYEINKRMGTDDIVILANTGVNQCLRHLGNKLLTVNYDKCLEAICKAAHETGLAYRYKCDKCTDGCSYCDGCGFILYPWVEPFANRLCTEIANCIHLSDGEGNTES